MDKYLQKNKLVIIVLLVLLVLLIVVGIFYFSFKQSKISKLAEIKMEKQNKCQRDGREFDKIFRERKQETLISSSEVVVGDGRFDFVDFKGGDICAYQNNWVEIIVANNKLKAFVYHRIINIDTQDELAGADWTKEFIGGEWKENFSDKSTEEMVKFIIAEEEIFGTSILFPNRKEYMDQNL